jgi:hypothetical protein
LCDAILASYLLNLTALKAVIYSAAYFNIDNSLIVISAHKEGATSSILILRSPGLHQQG